MGDPATLVLPATRPPKAWRTLGIGLAFTAGGFWLLSGGDARGWLVVVFFGLCSLVTLLQLLARGNCLRLDQDGFTVATLFVTRSYRWSEVDRFFVGHSGGADWVVFDLAPSRGRRSLNQRLTKRLLGHEAALPQAYGMTPEHLADLMNGWRTRLTGAVPADAVPAGAAVVVDQAGVRRRLPDGRWEAVRWADLVEVAIRTTPYGPWREDVFFLLTGRDGSGCAVPHGEAVDRDLLRWLQALPGFDNEQLCEAMCCAEDALFVCWRRQAYGLAGDAGAGWP